MYPGKSRVLGVTGLAASGTVFARPDLGLLPGNCGAAPRPEPVGETPEVGLIHSVQPDRQGDRARPRAGRLDSYPAGAANDEHGIASWTTEPHAPPRTGSPAATTSRQQRHKTARGRCGPPSSRSSQPTSAVQTTPPSSLRCTPSPLTAAPALSWSASSDGAAAGQHPSSSPKSATRSALCPPSTTVPRSSRIRGRPNRSSRRSHGIQVAEYNFKRHVGGRLALTLHQVLRGRRLDLPRDEDLSDELTGVRLRKNTLGVYRLDHDAIRTRRPGRRPLTRRRGRPATLKSMSWPFCTIRWRFCRTPTTAAYPRTDHGHRAVQVAFG